MLKTIREGFRLHVLGDPVHFVAFLGLVVVMPVCAAVAALTQRPAPACLAAGQTGTVVRVVDRGRDALRSDRVVVALKRRDGTVTTCAGGQAAMALGTGDVVDGRTLHPIETGL